MSAAVNASGSSSCGQPTVDARILFAEIDGVAHHLALDPEGFPLDAVVDRLVNRWST